MLKIGAHVSAAGGVHRVFERGKKVEAECLQLFTRPPSRWAATPLDDKKIKLFKEKRALHGSQVVVAHDIYLNNLASEKPETRQRSIETMCEELDRCQQLALDGLVCHIGSNPQTEEGLELYSSAIKEILERTETVPILLETCAGQGNTLGHRLEHLAEVIDRNDGHPRLGICVDTCHIFVAGYDLRDPKLYDEYWATFSELIGLDRLRLFHLNDSKKPVGSRVDRHDHIGEGEIGDAVFQRLLSDARFEGLPAVIETPDAENMAQTNIAHLKRLREKTA